MKEELKKLINGLVNIGHNSNTFADKKHENKVETLLLEYGYTEMSETDSKEELKKEENKRKTLTEFSDKKCFIKQPFGQQMAPDFIICINGFILWLECKSGKNGNNLQWNSGYPKSDILYMYSSKKTNNTTLFFGQDTKVVSKHNDFEERYNRIDTKLKKIAKELYDEEFGDVPEFDYYNRRMLLDNTNYEKSKIYLLEKTINLLDINEK